MKRSLILLSVLFTGLCNNLVYGAQSAAAANTAPTTPIRKGGIPSLFGKQESNTAQKHVQKAVKDLQETPGRVQSPHVQLITHNKIKLTTEERAQIAEAIANPPAARVTPSRTTNLMHVIKKYRVSVALATLVAVVCGLTLGETKYKMVSQLFKKAPATIPAKAVKVSWLKSLTGLFVR